jgi:hypothetical protein
MDPSLGYSKKGKHFKTNLWCSQNGNSAENDLAKFGYILDIKVKKTLSIYILGYLLKPIGQIWPKGQRIL